MKRYVNTSTLISFKYKDGVIVSTDTLGAYGYMSKLQNITRTFIMNTKTIVSYSGEYSDIQQLNKILKYELIKDKRVIDPQGIHKMVQRILYAKRSKNDPMNVFCVVAGVNEKKDDRESTDKQGRMLGAVTQLGNFYFSEVICYGLGAYLVTPFLRDRIDGRVDEIGREEAFKIAEEALQLLVYRECTSLNNFVIGYIEKDACVVEESKKIDTHWEIGKNIID